MYGHYIFILFRQRCPEIAKNYSLISYLQEKGICMDVQFFFVGSHIGPNGHISSCTAMEATISSEKNVRIFCFQDLNLLCWHTPCTRWRRLPVKALGTEATISSDEKCTDSRLKSSLLADDGGVCPYNL